MTLSARFVAAVTRISCDPHHGRCRRRVRRRLTACAETKRLDSESRSCQRSYPASIRFEDADEPSFDRKRRGVAACSLTSDNGFYRRQQQRLLRKRSQRGQFEKRKFHSRQINLSKIKYFVSASDTAVVANPIGAVSYAADYGEPVSQDRSV